MLFIDNSLGNVRTVMQTMVGPGSSTLTQSNDYYPFGMAFTKNAADSEEESFARENKYKYNGKEEQPMPGKWLDYGARFYDAQLGRWHSVDPHAENYYTTSSYAYVTNSPLIYLDPDGRDKYKFFAKFTLTQGKVGIKGRAADIGIGGTFAPFGARELSGEVSTTLNNSNGNVIFGISGEYADVSKGSASGTIALYSGSDTEKDITTHSWDSSEGGQTKKQTEKETTVSAVMFGKKTKDIKVKDSNGQKTETKREEVNTLKADVSLEINLLFIGFELNFGAHAETETK
ncbi:MAG: hypothetical protein CVT92_09970 [Bacteroidetes bacterium HGW-Bacteroidetes-1]|jgi:RHS repeat-associated protein|nr:MAG: hypothetical protein CVT92_09970 [Bacteroidetes bacterium HGW-Bacteroidetes-1]